MPAVGAMDIDLPFSRRPRLPLKQICDLIRQYMSLSATGEGGDEHPGARRRTAAPLRCCTSWSAASVRRSGTRMSGSLRPWTRSPAGSSSSRSSAQTSSPYWGMRMLRCYVCWMGT